MAGDGLEAGVRMMRTPRAAGVAFSLLLGLALVLLRLSVPSVGTEPDSDVDASARPRLPTSP